MIVVSFITAHERSNQIASTDGKKKKTMEKGNNTIWKKVDFMHRPKTQDGNEYSNVINVSGVGFNAFIQFVVEKSVFLNHRFNLLLGTFKPDCMTISLMFHRLLFYFILFYFFNRFCWGAWALLLVSLFSSGCCCFVCVLMFTMLMFESLCVCERAHAPYNYHVIVNSNKSVGCCSLFI